jgi:hypothetical protein
VAAAEGNNGGVVPMVGLTNWLNMDDKERKYVEKIEVSWWWPESSKDLIQRRKMRKGQLSQLYINNCPWYHIKMHIPNN